MDLRLRRVGWKIAVGVGLVSVAAYFIAADANVQLVTYDAIGLVAVVLMATGIVRNRPTALRSWIVLTIGTLLYTAGDTIWSGYELVLHRAAPWPSIADYVYLGGLVTMAIGILGILRPPGRRRDVEGVLDAAIVAAGVGTVFWAFFMSPYAADGSMTVFSRIVAISYPLMDVLLVAVIARLLLRPGGHATSHRLLGAAVASSLVADIVYSVQSLAGTYHTGHPVDAGWLAFYWLLAAAALHPSMAEPARHPGSEADGSGWLRFVALAGAASLAPITLVIQWLRDEPLDIPVIAASSVLLFLLVIARLHRVVARVRTTVRQLSEQQAMLERSLEAREDLERQLRYQALHDPLTTLANRSLFNERLTHAIKDTARSGRSVGLLFIDLDDFKVVNDSLGHEAGDLILMGLGERLGGVLRDTDIAARMGGDEFAILLEGMASGTDAERVAGRVLDVLDQPFTVGGRRITVHGSVGVSSSSDPATSGPDLLRQADMAMYAAKNAGKARLVVYDASLQDQLFGELRLLAQLQGAIERGEFRTVYQPIVELPGGEVVGAEALVRWQNPDDGLVPPALFLPVLERADTIFELDRWVLAEACREVARWKPLAEGRPFHVSVNVSAASLQRPDMVASTAAAIAAAGIEPGDVVLEVTESALVRDIEETVARLEELKQLGVGLAIDDFGTGYSSLEHLRLFPVDVLKIDKSFVDGIARGPEEASFAKAIITLADQLHLATTAEGVETADQADVLVELGADTAQGYHFSRPIPAEDLTELLRTGSALGRSSFDERPVDVSA